MKSIIVNLVLLFLYKILPIRPLARIYHDFATSGFATVKAMRRIESLKRRIINQRFNIEFLEECMARNLTPRFLDLRALKSKRVNTLLLENELKEKKEKLKSLEEEVRCVQRDIYLQTNTLAWLIYMKSLKHYLDRHADTKKKNN